MFLFFLCLDGGPQCLGPMVSSKGPPQTLQSTLCLSRCPGSDVFLSPAQRTTLIPEHTCTQTFTHSEVHPAPTVLAKGMMGGRSAYTEECLSPNERGTARAQHLSCRSDLQYATELLIAPPKIAHHYRCCATSSSCGPRNNYLHKLAT